ncbi:hypothetical protein M422DRAFT_49763 [Sphaerobolus stellatus SS14]|uniref:Protein kinase domain-containing protein n=1 Tax=Sphaerobolus stellatus (strain SS14) TaxID=990650 RepID=A0A0C9UVY7_SPHS4|nr:hypothetical protein M422DRAFT_49763 [Sphaerobolus stellatus SS14]
MFWVRKLLNHEPQPSESNDDDSAAWDAQNVQVIDFWENLRDWFSTKGYTLYKLRYIGSCIPSLQTPTVQVVETPDWPYAFWGDDILYGDLVPLEAFLSNKISFAHDRQGQHVAIKRLGVLDGSQEYVINRFLYENRKQATENCILPIIEILEYEGYSFAVMPRWGEGPLRPDFSSIGEILHYIHCLLKAVNFLHLNFIVHRDIKPGNTLVNHFGAYLVGDNEKRRNLRSSGKLTYALYDFDLSLMLPSTSSQDECRLPAWRSFEIITIESPYDTRQAEMDYNPFVFEMGCLGIMLCE